MVKDLSIIVCGAAGGILAIGIPTLAGWELGAYYGNYTHLGYGTALAIKSTSAIAAGTIIGVKSLSPGITAGMFAGIGIKLTKDISYDIGVGMIDIAKDYINKRKS